MAIVQNKATEIGDVLIIQVEVPILGLVFLSSYIDQTVGETAVRYFNKKFRYSVDGITFSDWLDLTNENIQLVDVEPTNTFRIEYRYQRTGSDITGDLQFNEVTVSGEYQALVNPEVYNRSIFSSFFDFYDIDLLNWALNVLEKIYKSIVPKYIERGVNDNINWEDKDFIDFWRSVTHFFAILVRFARLFENISSNKTLLLEYLRSHDLYVCDETDLVDLIYIMNNIFDEIRQRGTIQISLSKNQIDDSSDISFSDSSSSLSTVSVSKEVNGELLRLICYKTTDEFIFAPIQYIGWIVDKCSPLYRGTNFAYSLIKGYELSQDFNDLSKYPINDLNYCTLKNNDSKMVLSIDGVPNGLDIGLKSSLLTFPIIVDSSIAYEITFWIKQVNIEDTLTFGCNAFDKDGNQINLQSIVTGLNENKFFSEKGLNINNQWYFVRGIIFNKDQDLLTSSQALLDLGFGQHLRFNNLENITYICPQLYIENNTGLTSNEVLIWDFKIRPLKYDFEVGFVGLKNLLVTWMKNNSGKYTNDEVTNIMYQKLIPYNFALINNFI